MLLRFGWLLPLGALAVGLGVLSLTYAFASIPLPSSVRLESAAEVYDARGDLIGIYSGEQRRFLIDTGNLLALARRYRERWWEEREDGVIEVDEHSFDFLRGRNAARWTFIRPDGTRSELVHSVRSYTPHELAAMLSRAGLEVIAAWGGFDGSELSFDGARLILLAQKPKATAR